MGASICASVGLESLICDDAFTYEKKAVYFGNNPYALKLLIYDHLSQKEKLPLFVPQ
jgi:protein O-GlcNAc transferase